MPSSPLLLLALACALAPAAAFLDRAAGLHHFALPELRSPRHRRLAASSDAGHGYRHLAQLPDGTFPAVHESHDFVGATALGHVVYNASSILLPTTVSSDDYLHLLSTATISCSASAAPPPSLRMALAFPPAGADASAAREALAHLSQRLALPGAVLVLGVDTLLAHPSLGDDSACALAAGGAAPYLQ